MYNVRIPSVYLQHPYVYVLDPAARSHCIRTQLGPFIVVVFIKALPRQVSPYILFHVVPT